MARCHAKAVRLVARRHAREKPCRYKSILASCHSRERQVEMFLGTMPEKGQAGINVGRCALAE